MAFNKQQYDDAYAKEFLDRITIKARKDSGFLTRVDAMAEKMNMSRPGFIMFATIQYMDKVDSMKESELILLDWRVTFRPDVHAYLSMGLTEEEYDYLYDCAKEMNSVEDCPELAGLVKRLHEAALQICQEEGFDVTANDPFRIQIPEEVQRDAEMDMIEEMEEDNQ